MGVTINIEWMCLCIFDYMSLAIHIIWDMILTSVPNCTINKVKKIHIIVCSGNSGLFEETMIIY